MDPDIKKIKYEINNDLSHDFIAFIYMRFARDLIYFPIQGNRILNKDNIRKANKLNSKLIPYKIKSDCNKNFFIDFKRKSPVKQNKQKKNVNEILNQIFESKEFSNIICKIYDKNLYKWSKDYINKTNFHPLRHQYALLAVAVISELILANNNMRNKNKKILKNKFKIINYITNLKF